MINEGREVNENWDALWDVGTRIDGGRAGTRRSRFRSGRCGSAAPTRRPGASTSSGGCGAATKTASGRRCRASTICSASRWPARSRGCKGSSPATNCASSLRARQRRQVGPGGRRRATATPGFDVKYGVTSGLTWDFTVNTDFSQVEADEQQVNLTRFSLFFPEKRDFFLENSGIFQFGQATPGASALAADRAAGRPERARQDAILFFSRRIGLSETGESIPILGGTRLTGRVGAYQRRRAQYPAARARGPRPSTNFTALRLRRNVLANSDIGVIVLNKDADGPALQPRGRRRRELPILREPESQRRRRQDVLAGRRSCRPRAANRMAQRGLQLPRQPSGTCTAST